MFRKTLVATAVVAAVLALSPEIAAARGGGHGGGGFGGHGGGGFGGAHFGGGGARFGGGGMSFGGGGARFGGAGFRAGGFGAGGFSGTRGFAGANPAFRSSFASANAGVMRSNVIQRPAFGNNSARFAHAGNWNRGWGHHHGRHFRPVFIFAGGYPYYGGYDGYPYDYYDDGYYGDDGYYSDCYQLRNVRTSVGWRTVRINVCN